MPKKSAFELAHAGRTGEVPAEKLTGAARKLYNDKSLSDAVLAGYAETKKVKPPSRTGMHGRRMRAKV